MAPIGLFAQGPIAEMAPEALAPTVYSATVYGRYGENVISGGGHGDLLNAVFTGPDGDTFFEVTGGVTGGNLTDGYSGTLTNSYGGFIQFSGISRFNVSTGLYNDNITTGAGDDTISTGAGNDTLNSGSGRDVVDGGDGTSDRWIADTSFTAQAVVIDITAAGPQSYLGRGSVNGIESLFLTTGSGNDVITGYVSGNTNSISAGKGDDQITLGLYNRYGDDTVNGGKGDDLLTFTWTGDGQDTFFNVTGGVISGSLAAGYSGTMTNSYSGNLTFSGIERFHFVTGIFDDTITTGDGNDTVSSGAGADTIYGGKGSDVIDGGAGTSDRWVGDLSFATQAISIDITAGPQTFLAGGSVQNIESLFLTTGSGDDVVTAYVSGLDNDIATGAGKDVITIGNYGRYGANKVDGGTGSDRLVFTFTGDGGDTHFNVTGGASGGNLTNGYSGSFTNSYGGSLTFKGIERFSLTTGLYDDTLTTGDGADTVDSGAGNDVINTAAGIDVVRGGLGADRWVADKSAAAVGITIDLNVTGDQSYMGSGVVSGIESLDLRTGSGDDRITTLQSQDSDYVSTGAGDDIITLGGAYRYGADTADGGSGRDRLVIIDTGDTFFGLAGGISGGDLTHGYSGSITNGSGASFTFSRIEDFSVTTGIHDDNIATGDGRDLLDTSTGKDVLSAVGGIDTLIGGGGGDSLTGGAGADIFLYRATGDSLVADRDIITDFAGKDIIDLSAIDAKTGTPQDNRFVFIGEGAFTGSAGQLHVIHDGTNSYVEGDVDGDGAADFQIQLNGLVTLQESSFVL